MRGGRTGSTSGHGPTSMQVKRHRARSLDSCLGRKWTVTRTMIIHDGACCGAQDKRSQRRRGELRWSVRSRARMKRLELTWTRANICCCGVAKKAGTRTSHFAPSGQDGGGLNQLGEATFELKKKGSDHHQARWSCSSRGRFNAGAVARVLKNCFKVNARRLDMPRR